MYSDVKRCGVDWKIQPTRLTLTFDFTAHNGNVTLPNLMFLQVFILDLYVLARTGRTDGGMASFHIIRLVLEVAV